MIVYICKADTDPAAPAVDQHGNVDPDLYGSTGNSVDGAIENWIHIDNLCDEVSLPEYVDVYELVLKERKVRV